MAGTNYEVNIELKAGSALQAIERIEDKINKLGKSSKDLADERTAAMVKVRDAGDQVAKLEERGLKVSKARAQVDKASAALDKGNLATANARIEIAQREVNIIQGELALEKQITAEQKKQAGFAKQGRLGSAASGALIGGAFPLLFGQGGLSAAGGAVGGLAGIFGGQFGFAGSLIGTALGTALQEAEDFNRELISLNSNLTLSSNASITTAADIQKLASELNIASEEAAQLIKNFSLFGDGNVREELARVFGPVGGLEAVEAVVKARLGEKEALEAISELAPKITLEQAQQVTKLLETEGSLAAAAALQESILAVSQEDTKEKEKQVKFVDRMVAALSFLAGGMAGPAGLGLPESPLTPQGAEQIAEERAAAVEAPNMKIIGPALERLENFYNNRNRLEEKYGKSASNSAQTGEALVQSLRKQLARYEEIDPLARKIAMVEADYTANIERAAKIKDASKRADAESLANAVREAQLAKIIADEEERRAKADERRIATFNQRLFSADAEGRILQAELDGRGEEQRLLEQIEQQTKGLDEVEASLVEKRLRSNFALQQQQKEALKLQQIYAGIGQTISSGLVGMLEAVFDRTKSIGDAALNLLKNLANQMLSAGIQMLLSSISGPAGSIGGFLGKIFGGKKASGGPVKGGTSYLVGEKGPELFTPGASGMITPNHAMGGGASNIVVNVDASGTVAEGDEERSKQLGQALGAAVQAELIKQQRPGGLLAR